MSRTTLYGIITLVVGIEILADIALKQSVSGNWHYLLLGAFLYSMLVFPIAFAFKTIEFGTLFIVWEVIGVVLGLSVGTLYFGEVLTVRKITALIFAVGSLAFSELKK